jgi:hypothetical protein
MIYWKSCKLLLCITCSSGGLHIAVWFEHVLTLRWAPFSVAFGVYVPSHRSIKCRLYHCLIPSSLANLSATSLMMPSRSPSIVLVTLCARLLKNEPIEDEVEVGFGLEVVVLGIRLWPRVEVLSCESCQ